MIQVVPYRLSQSGTVTDRPYPSVSPKHTRPATSVAALPKPSAALRWLAPALLVTGVALISADRVNPRLSEGFRGTVTDLFAPVMAAVSNPAEAVSNGVEWGNGLVSLHAENQRLKLENERLRHWYVAAQRLSTENQNLRSRTGYDAVWAQPQLAARVVADTGGLFARSMLLDHGRKHGVFKGQVAVTSLGLVGRVQEVGGSSARLLLITDINSRVPAMLLSTGERMVVAGDNRNNPRLEYLQKDMVLHPGDMIVTSGAGGVFPPGIPLGTVMADGKELEAGLGTAPIRIKPAVDLERLSAITLMQASGVELPISGAVAGEGANEIAQPLTQAAADASASAAGTVTQEPQAGEAEASAAPLMTPPPARKPQPGTAAQPAAAEPAADEPDADNVSELPADDG